MPLNDRTRIILFWVTIALMLGVAVLAAITILRACGGLPTQSEPQFSIAPSEVTVCTGSQQQFAVEDDVEVSWEATGGSISQDGVFTAGDNPGDYSVTASAQESRRAAGAIVHIVACTPTPTATPLPTIAPTATPEQTPTPAPTATVSGSPDAQGDIGEYETGDAVESPPTGVDISAASLEPDMGLSFASSDELPDELVDWTEEGELLFWISLHDAVPDPPSSYMNWLFVVDADGDTETGRLVGSARVNPDLGDEFAVGVSYDANTQAYDAYALVWNPEEDGWAEGPEVRYTFGDSREVVGLAVSLEALEESMTEVGAASMSRDAARGRAAAETYLADGTRVIDFYPNLPE